METLEHPDIQIDMHIIANGRLAALKAHGDAPLGEPGFTIRPFRCAWRGYLVHDGVILMFGPGRFNVDFCLPAIVHPSPPYEVWILEDDKVIDYYELPEPE